MKIAAETIAWFVCGGEREDYRCDFHTSRLIWIWVGWAIATIRLRAKARDLPRRAT